MEEHFLKEIEDIFNDDMDNIVNVQIKNLKNPKSQKDEIERQLNYVENDDYIEQHYMKLLQDDYLKHRRSQRDKLMRQDMRRMFSVLTSVIKKVQRDPFLNIDGTYEDDIAFEINRCRHSDLRILKKTNKLLGEMLASNRKLRQQSIKLRRELKLGDVESKPKKQRKFKISNQAVQYSSRHLFPKFKMSYPEVSVSITSVFKIYFY